MRISTEPTDADVQSIHRFLSQEAYWAKGIAIETVRKAIGNSLCFLGFVDDELVAFGRAVTDLATHGYFKDIFVASGHRGQGYGKALVRAMLERLELEGVGSVMLSTEDAHGLYQQFGFELIGNSQKLMRRVRTTN
jgi:GNAT superfamily N-acetyltransferase